MMNAAENLTDIFLDDPGFKFVNCYHKIPVFKKLSTTGTTGRFWFAFAIENEQLIILGPDATRLDFVYAISFMVAHPLHHHLITCRNDEAAAVVSFQNALLTGNP